MKQHGPSVLKPVLIFAFALSAFIFSSSAFAANNPNDKIVTFAATYVKDETNDALDYSVGVPFLKKEQIDVEKTKGTVFDQVTVRDERPRGGNGLTLFFEAKNGAAIKPGAVENITIYIKNAPEKVIPFKGTSTFRKKFGAGRIPSGDPVPLTGFKVVKDPEYSILNDELAPSTFTIKNLQFLVNVPEESDTAKFLDFGNSYGFGPSKPDFTVTAAQLSSDVFNVPHVDFEKWFYARGQLFIGDEEVSSFVHGQTTVTPEPVSALLFVMGGLALAFRKRFV